MLGKGLEIVRWLVVMIELTEGLLGTRMDVQVPQPIIGPCDTHPLLRRAARDVIHDTVSRSKYLRCRPVRPYEKCFDVLYAVN